MFAYYRSFRSVVHGPCQQWAKSIIGLTKLQLRDNIIALACYLSFTHAIQRQTPGPRTNFDPFSVWPCFARIIRKQRTRGINKAPWLFSSDHPLLFIPLATLFGPYKKPDLGHTLPLLFAYLHPPFLIITPFTRSIKYPQPTPTTIIHHHPSQHPIYPLSTTNHVSKPSRHPRDPPMGPQLPSDPHPRRSFLNKPCQQDMVPGLETGSMD